MDISKLFPVVSFPVSRGTPMISNRIKWNHDEDFYVPKLNSFTTHEHSNFTVNLSEKTYKYIQGHVIDGMY